MSEQQRPEKSSIVSGAQTLEHFNNAIAYEPLHRHPQNVPEQKMHLNSEMKHIDHIKDDHLPNASFDGDATAAAVAAASDADLNVPTIVDDFVDNVSTSDPYDSTSCLRNRKITKSARQSSPKLHCNNNNKLPSSASTCDVVQPRATLRRQSSAGYDDDMTALHRPHFASGAKLKKIVFNGTFPIDDPYSSRFDYEYDGHLLQ